MSEYPRTVYKVLELAESGTPPGNLPAELKDALRFSLGKGLVGIVDARQLGWSVARTVRKKARELRPGDVIQLQPDDPGGFYVVESVTVHDYKIEVCGSGLPSTWRPDADVMVYDGAPPCMTYSAPRLKLWPDGDAALSLSRMNDAKAQDQQPEVEHGEPTPAKPGMSVQEAAARMERLRSQGEPYTSQHKLAKALGCSSKTVNEAIHKTPSLQGWAKQQGKATPRAQSINPVVTDNKAQSREPDPADDAAIREYLERDLTPEERAFFNGLSREDQLAVLDDPDAHGLDEQVRILGRKP